MMSNTARNESTTGVSGRTNTTYENATTAGMPHHGIKDEKDEVRKWCEERIEKIQEVVRGGEGVEDLMNWMMILDVESFRALHAEMDEKREERIKLEERLRRSTRERKKIERELEKLEKNDVAIDAKLKRLREYGAFIERGWKEEGEEDNEGDGSGMQQKRFADAVGSDPTANKVSQSVA